jgi:hypothetical protein
MSASSKTPEGLKDSECEKGHLGYHPPVPYVPPTDLRQTKNSSETLKVKLADGTVFFHEYLRKEIPGGLSPAYHCCPTSKSNRTHVAFGTCRGDIGESDGQAAACTRGIAFGVYGLARATPPRVALQGPLG